METKNSKSLVNLILASAADDFVFIDGISFQILSAYTVFNLKLYSCNFAVTTMWPGCNCHPGQLCKSTTDTAATKMLAEHSSMCGFCIRNICHGYFKTTSVLRNQRLSAFPLWMNALVTVCSSGCYFNIWKKNCQSCTHANFLLTHFCLLLSTFVYSPWLPLRLKWQVELADQAKIKFSLTATPELVSQELASSWKPTACLALLLLSQFV